MNQNPNLENYYNSGLNVSDWKSLRDVLWPFIHAKDPSTIMIPPVPEHLAKHPLVELIKKYKATSDENYLDLAGRYLVPTNEPFGWYVVLTK